MIPELQKSRELIQDFQRKSERIFTRIATSYPTLLNQFDSKLSHSREAMKDLEVLAKGESSLVDSQLGYKLGVTKDLIEESSYFLNENTKVHADLVKQLEQEISGIQEIDASIASLKDVSIDMEIISINTLTVAVKAGKAGGAFSYITSEIRKLTQRMIGLADDLAQKGTSIEDTLESYQTTIRGSLSSQQDLLSNLKTDINRSFDTFFKETQVVISILQKIMDTATQIRKPFLKVMQTVQMQDILRQSLDHIILFVEEKEKSESDDSMDELRFNYDASRLSNEILRDTRSKYRESVQAFGHEYDQLKGLFEAMREHIGEFKKHFETTGSKASAFGENFKIATKIIEDVVYSLNSSLHQKSNVSNMSRELDTMVSSLEKDLSAIGALVDRFQNINVASRIEVARQIALKEMNKNIEEMSEVIVKIETNVTDALTRTKDFITGTKNVVSLLSAQSEEETDYIQNFSTQLKAMYQDVFTEGEKMQESISHFSLVEGDFLSSFSIIEEDLRALQDLEGVFDILGNHLETLSINCQKLYNQGLEEKGVSTWEVRDDRIKKLLSEFTIFTHKKAASDLAGIGMADKSVDSGEVTLF